MKVELKHKNNSEMIFTWVNVGLVSISGEFLSVERADTGKGKMLVGQYSLDSFDFEITDDE